MDGPHNSEKKGDDGPSMGESEAHVPTLKAIRDAERHTIQFVASLFGQPVIVPQITGRRMYERSNQDELTKAGREIAEQEGAGGSKAVKVHNAYRTMMYKGLSEEERREYEEKAAQEKKALETELKRGLCSEEIFRYDFWTYLPAAFVTNTSVI